MQARSYTRTAALLHWAIAVFIMFNLALGYVMEGLPPPWRMVVVAAHASSGLSGLILTALRVVWRLTHEPPPHVPPLSAPERNGAHLVHALLYLGMVLMPLSGWAILSAHPAPGSSGFAAQQAAAQALHPGAPPMRGGGITLWWTVPWPSIAAVQDIGADPGGLPAQKRLHDRLVDWHSLGSFFMIALLMLHLGGALKHQVVDGVPILRRMSLRMMPPSERTGEEHA